MNSDATATRPTPDPSGVDAHHALAQRPRGAGAGHQRLAHLQRLAVLSVSRFPTAITLGGWLGGALQWHFAAMWLLAVNGLVYLALNIASGRLFTQVLPAVARRHLARPSAALRGKLSHADPRHYNSVQRFAYLFVMLDIALLVLSGLVLWKSVQFALLRELLGGYEFARRIHFFAMALLVGLRRGAPGDGRAGAANVAGDAERPRRRDTHEDLQAPAPWSASTAMPSLDRSPQADRAADRAARAPRLPAALADAGRPVLLTGCSISDNDSVEAALTRDLALQRRGAGLDLRPQRSWRRPIPSR